MTNNNNNVFRSSEIFSLAEAVYSLGYDMGYRVVRVLPGVRGYAVTLKIFKNGKNLELVGVVCINSPNDCVYIYQRQGGDSKFIQLMDKLGFCRRIYG